MIAGIGKIISPDRGVFINIQKKREEENGNEYM